MIRPRHGLRQVRYLRILLVNDEEFVIDAWAISSLGLWSAGAV